MPESGSVTMSGSTISGSINHEITIGTSLGLDTYLSPLTVTSGGSIETPASRYAILIGAGLTNVSLINEGLIQGGTYAALALTSGVSLNNAGTIEGATGSGTTAQTGAVGVRLSSTASLTDNGLIKGGSGGTGQTSAGYGGNGLFLNATAPLLGSGTIAGGTGGAPISAGGTGGAGGYGIAITGINVTLAGGLLHIVGGAGGSGGAVGGYGGAAIADTNVGVDLTVDEIVTGGAGGNGTSRGQHGGYGIAATYTTLAIDGGVITGGAGGNGATGGRGGAAVDALYGALLSVSGRIVGGAGGSGTSQGGDGSFGATLNGLSGTTVLNATIIGGAGGAGGSGEGGYGGLGLRVTSGALVNDGTIMGGAPGTGLISGNFGGGGLTASDARVTNAGLIESAAGGTGLTTDGATILNTGTGIGNGNAAVYLEDQSTFTNAGLVEAIGADAVKFGVTKNDLLVVDPSAVFIGTVAAIGSAADELELAGTTAGTLVGIGTSFDNFATLDFAAGASWTVTGDLAGLDAPLISGFGTTDTIVLDGKVATGDVYAGGHLTLSGTSGEIGTFDIAEPSSYNFVLSNDGTNTTIAINCFAAGTRILTPKGEVPVEDIRTGDEVVTLHDPAHPVKPVIWTGSRSFDTARAANPQALWPVRIAAGAFAPGVPGRDLLVSPHHALYWNGALFEALSLVNGISIVQEQTCRFITYHHLEVAGHDVLLAEGLPAESYLETGGRDNFEGPAMRLHASFEAPPQAEFCAPLVRAGAALEELRTHLVARAGRAPRLDRAVA